MGVLTAYESVYVCVCCELCEWLQRLGGYALEKTSAETKPVIASAILLSRSFKHTHTQTHTLLNRAHFSPDFPSEWATSWWITLSCLKTLSPP